MQSIESDVLESIKRRSGYKRPGREAIHVMPHGSYGWEHGMGFGMWLLHWFIPLLTLVAIIAAIFILIRWKARDAEAVHDDEEADRSLEILRQRYARGEIDREEFEQKKKDLRR